MWGSYYEINQMKGWLKRFEELNKDVKVKLITAGQNYTEKVLAAFAAGIPPDVFMVGTGLGLIYIYAEKGVLLPLDKYIGEIKDDIHPSALELMRWKGHYYAIPREINAGVLFYNKDLFDQNNIPYPSEDWDWDKFIKVAKKFVKLDRQGHQIQFGCDSIPWLEIALSKCAKIVNENGKYQLSSQPEVKKAIVLLQKAQEENIIPSKSEETSLGKHLDSFCTGRVAMFFGGPWHCMGLAKKGVSFKWDMALIPKGKEKRVTYLQTCGYGISKACRNKELAWKLVKFLVSPEILKEFAMTGRAFPASRKAQKFWLADKVFSEVKNKNVPKEVLSYGVLFPPKSIHRTQIWRDIIEQEVDKIMLKMEPMERVLKRMDKRINKLIGKD